ncbi:YciI family protein [uncultured Hoeflea sp.]|uniref:YciI family protein n=1 Tax=uncultured Hoeflea sp. TaxID=538666 RepID=UPI0026328141|nr:YciI family protein [uncultured Hoeflea sp.]
MAFLDDGDHLFAIDLTYVTGLENIDPLIAQHMTFIERGYASGLFLASGAKVPRTGGVIIARGRSRADIETLIKDDPFHSAGVAEYTVTEFLPGNLAAALK